MTTPAGHSQRFLAPAWLPLAAAMLLSPATARANMGPPSSGGQIVAEPVGIQDVEITRELLTIDLRPLAHNGLALVDAAYHLHNHAGSKKLDLLFATASPEVADFQVWLGDHPVASYPAEGTQLPASWQPPPKTPGLVGGQKLEYGRHGITPMALTVMIPPGRHDLKVHYAATAAWHYHGDPTVYRQFAYVLAPARSWAGFGGLDLAIHLPAGWRAACEPTLAREADTLKGSFDHVPADAIALTVQAPQGEAYQRVVYGGQGLLALACLAGLVLCWQGGRSRGRRLALPRTPEPTWLQRHAWPWSLAMGVTWGLALLGAGLVATLAPDWALPVGQASHYGYGQVLAILGVILLSLLALPVGFAIAQVTAVRTRHRTLPRLDADGPLRSEQE
jgi:hypothetical protein